MPVCRPYPHSGKQQRRMPNCDICLHRCTHAGKHTHTYTTYRNCTHRKTYTCMHHKQKLHTEEDIHMHTPHTETTAGKTGSLGIRVKAVIPAYRNPRPAQDMQLDLVSKNQTQGLES